MDEDQPSRDIAFEESFRQQVAGETEGDPKKNKGEKRKLTPGMWAILGLGVLMIGVIIAGVVIQNNIRNSNSDGGSSENTEISEEDSKTVKSLVGEWGCDDGTTISFDEKMEVTWARIATTTIVEYDISDGVISFGKIKGSYVDDEVRLIDSLSEEIICQRSET